MATRTAYSFEDPFGLNANQPQAFNPNQYQNLPEPVNPNDGAGMSSEIAPPGGTATIPATAVPTPASGLSTPRPRVTPMGQGTTPTVPPPAPAAAPTDNAGVWPTDPTAHTNYSTMPTPEQLDAAYQHYLGRARQPNDTQYLRDPNYISNLAQTPEAQNYAHRSHGTGNLQNDFTTATNGLTANERDQGSLQTAADRLTALGYPTTIAQTDPQGRNQGLIINGKLYRVIDSSGHWTLVEDNNGSAWGGDDEQKQPFGGGAGAFTHDPNGAANDQALSDLIAGHGSTPFGSEVQKALAGIISSGGIAPNTDEQLIQAREDEANASRSMMNDARNMLANRGTLSEPGVAQGPNEEAVANVARSLAPSYHKAVTDINTNAATLKQQSLMSALTTATGMSEAQANTILSTVGTGTNRTTALGNIALSVLHDNVDWNKFLAQNGLDQARLQADIDNNNWTHVIQLLNAFILQGHNLNEGTI